MRNLYNLVNSTLEQIDFNEIWNGFERGDFALYNKTKVYLKEDVIPYDNRFLGNTTIKYKEKNLAIWYVENENDEDYRELSANIVHEMFHSYQFLKGETRFPNDIEGLAYPNILENYNLKYNENSLLINGLDAKNKSEKVRIFKKLVASRKLRLKKFGDLIKYEFEIETAEGSAEYCGVKSLRIISDDLYEKRIESYKKLIIEEKKILFDIRKSCYFTGTLFLLFLDEIGVDFSRKIENEQLTIFEQVSSSIDTSDVNVKCFDNPEIEKQFKEEKLRKENTINKFLKDKLSLVKGKFNICGYDPMNMFKIDNRIFCSHFIILRNIETKEKIFINGPVLMEIDEDADYVKEYYKIK